jgi:hypothetical protein
MTEPTDARLQRTKWFRRAGWGIFHHWLGNHESAEEWNARVDGFDADRWADAVAATGAGYAFFTIGQNSGHYCAPNDTYDAIVGRRPSLCSRRDLIADLADALDARGIPLMVYLPSGAPTRDGRAVEALRWEWGYQGPWGQVHSGPTTGNRLEEFQQHWERVIREWSLRWGPKIRGWWIDGCYFATDMYAFEHEPNWVSLTAAFKAGNDQAIVAYNPGVRVPVVSQTEHEDYTAGELSAALPVGTPGEGPDGPIPPIPSDVNGAQYHVLCYLGQGWGCGGPRFPDDLAAGFTRYVTRHGGVVTWDLPVEDDGTIPEPYPRQLRAVAEAAETGAG